jgi:hypothetical protein
VDVDSKEKTIEKLGKKDPNEIVTFYFRMLAFDDKSKGFLTFPIRKHPNKHIETYTWFDGQKCKAPRYVVEHLSSRFVTAPANEAEDGERKKVYRFELDVL